jgi:hypothetical protein
MKGLKLSKTSWLILLAGIFLVALAGLGLTRSQQSKEQASVQNELSTTEKLLAASQTTQLSQQLENLKAKLEDSQAQLKEAQSRLHQTVISADITEKFFRIAESCSVNITSFTTSTILQAKYQNVSFSEAMLSARVVGKATDIVNFVIALNNGYVTGAVQSAQLDVEAPIDGAALSESPFSEGSISMNIYSYEGN